MGCASSAPFNPGAVANDAPIDADAAASDANGGGLAAKLRRNASDIVDTTTSSMMGEAGRLKDGAMAKMQDMGETIQETAEEAADKVTDKLTSTFKDLTSTAEEKVAEVEEDAAEAEAAIAEAKARAEEDIENEVRNMVEDLEQELPPPDMPPPDSDKPAAESQHVQETNDGTAVTGVIITELQSDEQSAADATADNLGLVQMPDGELLVAPRDALERETEGSPPPSATSRPTSPNILEQNSQPQVVPFPFANLTETTTNEQKEEEDGEEGGEKTEPEKEHEETGDDARVESPAYEEIMDVEPTESANDNASISELNNNGLVEDEDAKTADEDATHENNNIETVDNENTNDLENSTAPEEESATNDAAKDENDNDKGMNGNDNDKEKEEDESDSDKEKGEDDGMEKDVDS